MDDSGSNDDPPPSLRHNYVVTAKKARHIPMTFTRQRPSYFVVDLFWTAMAFLTSLIFAGRQLRKRRGTIWFPFHANAGDLDFRKLDPDLIVKYLSKHKDKVKEAIDAGNGHIDFLARFIDPLHPIIASPHKVTVWIASVVMLYFIIRFAVLHRHWRYNTLLLLLALATYLPINWLSPADSMLALHLTLSWIMPSSVLISIILHRILGHRAWKPRTVVFELARKNDREGGGWEDTDALLDYDEITKRAIN